MRALLAATLALSHGLELTMLPSSPSAILLPGETRTIPLDGAISRLPYWLCGRTDRPRLETESQAPARMRDLLVENDLVGQLLIMPSGSPFTVVPVLKRVSFNHISHPDAVTLTCIGRARVRLPVRDARDAYSAPVEPLFDVVKQQTQPDFHTIEDEQDSLQSLYNSCRSLAARAQEAPLMSAEGRETVDLFKVPLRTMMKERKSALCSALGGACDAELQLHTAASETEMQLLSYAVAGSDDARMAMLACNDSSARLAHAQSVLQDFERRLAAEISLQGWGAERGA